MFPEYVGLRCMDGVMRLFDGQRVPVRDVTPTVSMTADNLEKYYPKKDGVWTPDFAAIAAIPTKGDCTKVKGNCSRQFLEDPMKFEAIKIMKTSGFSFRCCSHHGCSDVCAVEHGFDHRRGHRPNGAVVPNATVTVTNQGTNEKRTVQADGEGRYEVPSLPTGVYTIESNASGFQVTSVKDLRLAVGERARADVILGLTGVDAVVEVVDQTRTDTETSTIGDTIGEARITDNPVNGRDFTQLLGNRAGLGADDQSVSDDHQRYSVDFRRSERSG